MAAPKTTPNKTGRKQRHHVAKFNGKTIEGLSRRPSDGRWRVIGTQITFTEPDERKAVARFYALKAQMGETVPARFLYVPEHEDKGDPFDFDRPIQVETGDKEPRWLSEAEAYQWFAEQIRTKPEYVATMTGIEWIEYGPKLKAPEPLPTFKELEDVWKTKTTASAEQRRKVLAAWRDFVKASTVATLDDITPQVCIAYRDAVYARNTSPKSQLNLFTRIRRLVSFAKSRAIAMTACTKALEALELLKPSDTVTSLNPMPIEVADFKALLKVAGADDHAMILCMLNFGMYLAEVLRLEWSDVQGDCLIAHRAKTGKHVRIAVIWQETKDALAKVERKGSRIFYTEQTGAPLGIKGAELRFRELRIAAKVEHVTSSQFRDGAATAIAAANVNEKLLALALGHSCGISDHYVKRNPKMVEPASAAIYTHYFG